MINKGKMSKVVYPRGRQGQDRMDKWKVEREQSINKINWNLKQPEQHKVFCSSWLTMSESLKSYSLLLASLFKHSMETEERQLMVKMCQLWTITVINSSLSALRASFVAQPVKNLPAMRETWVWSLGWQDPLEEGIFAWRVPWTEEPSRLQSMVSQRVRHDSATKHSTLQALR